MSRLEIIDARPYHCGQIARMMRVEHHAALLRMNVPIHKEFRRMFDGSYYRKAALVDGKLAAVWGVESTPINSDGIVWLALAQHAVKHTSMILRQAKRELEALAQTKRHLTTTLIPGDETAMRFAVALGFRAADDSAEGARAESRDGKRRLMRYLSSNPDLLVPAGSARQISIVWEAA